MLNISGNGSNNDEESGTNGSTGNVNIGALGTPHQVHQVHNPNGSTSFVYEYYKVPDKDGLQWRFVLEAFFSLFLILSFTYTIRHCYHNIILFNIYVPLKRVL